MRMTTREMYEMRISGATYQEIADESGISKQAVHDALSRYIRRLTSGIRGHRLCLFGIKYKAIREYFANNVYESINTFAKKTDVQPATMKNFLTGKSESRFTIPQIKQICEIVGKPFEEVFGGDDDE